MAEPVLQGIGIGPANDYSGFFHANAIAAQTADRQQRDKDRQQARNDQTSEYFQKELDPAKRFTGTVYDEHNAKELGDILTQANTLAAQGMSVSQIQMQIGKPVNDFNTRYAAEKQINKNIEDYASRFKGQPGFNYERILSHAKGLAFQNYDPKTSTYSGIKDANQLDPNTNWVEEAIKQHPEDVTNSEGLSKTLAGMKRDKSNPRSNTKVGQDEYKVGYDSELYPFQKFSDERDQYGNPKGVEVGATVAMDGGKPITDEQGQPMKIVPDETYNFLRSKPRNDSYLTGLAKQEFSKTGMQMPKEGDPKWDLWKKHELWKFLQENASSSYSPIAEKTSQSQRIQMLNDPRYIQALQDVANARRTGTIQANEDNGITTGKTPKEHTTVAQGVASVFNGEYDGSVVDYKGKKYEDVTGAMPNGSLKFGKSDKETYDQVLFDPSSKTLLAVKKDGTEVKATEAQAGQFIASHSEANGSTVGTARKELGQFGYSGGRFANGKVTTSKIDEANQNEQADRVAHVDKVIESGDYDQLKGTQTSEGKILDVNSKWVLGQLPGVDRFKVKIKTPEGKTIEKGFSSKEEMAAYLKGGAVKSSTTGKKDIQGF